MSIHNASHGARRSAAALKGWLLSHEPVTATAHRRGRSLRLTFAATLVVVAGCIAALGLVSGCGNAATAEASEPQAATPQKVSYTVVNFSEMPLREVVLYGDGLGKKLGYGQIRTGGRETLTASEGLYVPMQVNLDWTTAAGDRCYKKLNLWGALGAGYQGSVTLTVDDRGQVQITR